MRVDPIQPKPIVFVGRPEDSNKHHLNGTIFYPKPDGQDIVIINGKGFPV